MKNFFAIFLVIFFAEASLYAVDEETIFASCGDGCERFVIYKTSQKKFANESSSVYLTSFYFSHSGETAQSLSSDIMLSKAPETTLDGRVYTFENTDGSLKVTVNFNADLGSFMMVETPTWTDRCLLNRF